MDGANSSYISVRKELLGSFPELSKKIESGAMFNNDILKIARSVLVQERDDGSIFLEHHSLDRNADIPPRQISLIMKICSLLGHQQTRSDVKVVRGKKRKLEVKQDEEDSATKKIKKEEARNIEDFFNKKSGLPESLMTLTAEYIDQSASLAVDFATHAPDSIPEYLKNITELDLSEQDITYEVFLTILAEFKNLKSLTLPSNVTDDWFVLIKGNVPNLIKLVIIDADYLTNTGLFHIADKFKSLQKVDFSGCDNIRNSGIDKIITSLSGLIELNLNCCYGINDDGLVNINQRSETLQVLGLSGFNITGRFMVSVDCFKELREINLLNAKISTEFLSAITSEKIPKIEELDFSRLESLTAESLRTIIKHNNNVRILYMQACDNIDDEALDYIAAECPFLENLDIGNCIKLTNSSVNNLLRNCKALKGLSLYSNTKIDERAFQDITNSNLEDLNLNDCINVTDTCLYNISISCPNLNQIHLRKCNITDAGIQHLTQRIRAFKAIVLNNPNITELGLSYLARWGNSIAKIVIEGCKKINFKNFANSTPTPSFPALTSLFANNCTQIDDEDLRNFPKWFPSLKMLSLAGCDKITFDCVYEILEQLTELHYFGLDKCKLISDSERKIINDILEKRR